MGRNTVLTYLKGDPLKLCRSNVNCNRPSEYSIAEYIPFIIECINQGMFPAEIHRKLTEEYNYKGSYYAFYNHLARNKKHYGWTICTRMNPKGHTAAIPQSVTRSGVFNHLWNHGPLSEEHREYIFSIYPALQTIDRCIREFRDIFAQTCVNRLNCFINKYSHCGISSLESFASNLRKDIDAVENAVSYAWNNGFVEGSNNKLKLVKRAMYGRCSRRLLEAKLLLGGSVY